MIPGRATPEGTQRYARRHAGRTAPGHFRTWQGLCLSSIGVGTYLGDATDEVDRRYEAAVRMAWALGGNVVDTAINYRFQRSERAIGRALAAAIAAGELARDEILISTKAGFIAFDGETPSDARPWFEKNYVRPGVASWEDIVAGAHVMTPAYVAHELEVSRRNLGVETIDLLYLHNPEVQLGGKSQNEFYSAVRAVFEVLEQAAREGRIGVYGVATWEGLRVPPEAPDHLSLARLVVLAGEAGGPGHHFRAIQLPYNAAMPEAFRSPTQDGRPPIAAAAARGMLVQTSASILQGRLARRVPQALESLLPDLTPAQRALQWVRSTPGVTVALVGMSRVEHVEENFAMARMAPQPAHVEESLRSWPGSA